MNLENNKVVLHYCNLLYCNLLDYYHQLDIVLKDKVGHKELSYIVAFGPKGDQLSTHCSRISGSSFKLQCLELFHEAIELTDRIQR